MAGIITWLANRDKLAPNALESLSESDLSAMLHFGAVAAGINCSRIGANPPTRAEVEAVLNR
jgi:fructokinase